MSSKYGEWIPLTELVEWVDGTYGSEAAEGVVSCLAESIRKYPDLTSHPFCWDLLWSLNEFAISRKDFTINYVVHDVSTEIFDTCRIVNVCVEFCADYGARHKTVRNVD